MYTIRTVSCDFSYISWERCHWSTITATSPAACPTWPVIWALPGPVGDISWEMLRKCAGVIYRISCIYCTSHGSSSVVKVRYSYGTVQAVSLELPGNSLKLFLGWLKGVEWVMCTSLPFFLKLMTYRLNNLSLPLGLQMRFVAAPYLLQTQEPWPDRVMCVPTLSPRKKVCWKGTAQTLALGTLSSPLLDGYSAPLA